MNVDARAILAGAAASSGRPSIQVDKEDDLTYDLGHLYAFDPAPVEAAAKSADGLKALARENMQLLTNRLYDCLTKGAGGSKMLALPRPTSLLPREKPLPVEEAATRWERFAKEKGIQKKKRSKMVWDEQEQRWAPRFGYGRANNPKEAQENWVVEAKHGDDGSVDPFELRSEAKKERLNKQKRQEVRNRLEAAHAATVGGGAGHSATPGSRSAISGKESKKAYLKQAIAAAQVSTASVGRFDRKLAGEPSKKAGKRSSYEGGTGTGDTARDADRTASVVERMFPTAGGKAKRFNAGDGAVDGAKAAKQARLRGEASNSENKAAKSTGRRSSNGKAKGKGGKRK